MNDRGAKEENKVKTIADAILDRIVHRAPRVELLGESMRKRGSEQQNNFK